MFKTNRAMVASLVVGIIGACIGGLIILMVTRHPGRLAWATVGVITSFLVCYLISQLYLKFLKNRTSQWAHGILFGGLAGLVSGLLTAIGITFYVTTLTHTGKSIAGSIAIAISGTMIGAFSGLIIGTILSFIFRSKIAIFLPRTNEEEQGN